MNYPIYQTIKEEKEISLEKIYKYLKTNNKSDDYIINQFLDDPAMIINAATGVFIDEDISINKFTIEDICDDFNDYVKSLK